MIFICAAHVVTLCASCSLLLRPGWLTHRLPGAHFSHLPRTRLPGGWILLPLPPACRHPPGNGLSGLTCTCQPPQSPPDCPPPKHTYEAHCPRLQGRGEMQVVSPPGQVKEAVWWGRGVGITGRSASVSLVVLGLGSGTVCACLLRAQGGGTEDG